MGVLQDASGGWNFAVNLIGIGGLETDAFN
jgi:hypothetical protein